MSPILEMGKWRHNRFKKFAQAMRRVSSRAVVQINSKQNLLSLPSCICFQKIVLGSLMTVISHLFETLNRPQLKSTSNKEI